MNRRGVAHWLVLLVVCLLATGAGAGGRLAADDAAPAVVAVQPASGATGVALDAVVVVTFSEPVNVAGNALWLGCERSGAHAVSIEGDGLVFTFTPNAPFAPNESCGAIVRADAVTDQDSDDPPDIMSADVGWSFHTAPPPLLINELDAIADESAEFIELYDDGKGQTSLDGLTLVLYRGDEASVYLAVDLTGYRTDGRGYFVAGAAATPADLRLANGTLRDGPNAVALYAAPRSRFPTGGPVVVDDLLDAIVYAPNDQTAPGLMPLLLADQQPLDEAQRGAADAHSAQRVPNGRGQPRTTDRFAIAPPTPDAENQGWVDAAPAVVAFKPAEGATGVDVATRIEVTFSEPVILGSQPIEIRCEVSGVHGYGLSGGNTTYRFQPYLPLARGKECTVFVTADRLSDVDLDDPPDGMGQDFRWSFATAPPVAQTVIINEVDADTPGSDTAEFIELYDGGVGGTSLDGLLVVLFNGGDDSSYRTIDLAGHTTDAAGYFLLANAAVAGVDLELSNGLLQNGPDAIALVDGQAEAFPNGTPVAGVTPRDAVVYGSADEVSTELLSLLNSGQAAIDENARGDAENHSNQRCPNGTGGARNSDSFRQNTPTPRKASDCLTDVAPTVTARAPGANAVGVAVTAPLTFTFSEPVDVGKGWLTIACSLSGTHDFARTGGPESFVARPTQPFAHNETCTATLKSRHIHDLDTDDPPDRLASNLSWQFTTAGPLPDFLLINEIDPDTVSSDTAEFIELYDGGVGPTPLDGLVLVFYNGYTNTVYRAIDLDGQRTDAGGYWLAGNAAVTPDLVFPDGSLQNGPDAVALYAGDAAQFPTDAPLQTAGLIDAVVYGDADGAAGLLPLLLSGETAANEAARNAADRHALQRCPNGAGGQRRNAAFRANDPTPGQASNCAVDDAPTVTGVTPADGATQIAADMALTVSFSEPMTPAAGWLRLTCAGHEVALTVAADGPNAYRATPATPLPHAAQCQAKVIATLIHDADTHDPPDALANDYAWDFSTIAPVADFILINELDADTPGNDTAEFIELYDGGVGSTRLDGLVLVFYNGYANTVYDALDLDGQRTNAGGYWLAGNEAVTPNLTFPNSRLQNGPDAVALYAGDATQFPTDTPLRTAGLIDAVVYGDATGAAGLLPLLLGGETAANEAARNAADRHALQRCPNGAGGQRRNAAFRANDPTPGQTSNCAVDDAPTVTGVTPASGATQVAADATLTVSFSEPMTPTVGWLRLTCASNVVALTIVADGPNAYRATPATPLPHATQCQAKVIAALIRDADTDDPPDALANDYAWDFTTTAPVADFILINELDADTPSNDTAEFIELYDGGVGSTRLDGLVLVFYNGYANTVYDALDLDGQRTNANGYWLAGNETVIPNLIFPNSRLQNGPDAVALYAGDATQFPADTPLQTASLLDAVVYGDAAGAAGLLPLLLSGETAADEASRGAADHDALQRCPNGAGGQRRTAALRANTPTPGAPSNCAEDAAPTVTGVTPADGATQVAADTALTVSFSEPMSPATGWLRLTCAGNEVAINVAADGPNAYRATPTAPLPRNATCRATVTATLVHDADNDDPPDTPAADYTWSFSTAAPVATSILINELDADTPGSDTAEFIELYDGGVGHTDLSGLVLVLFNGQDDRAYTTIDLDGARTNANGFALIGSAALEGDITLPAATLQNGPDAAALYEGNAADFPSGTAITTAGLRDALVYGTDDPTDTGLLPLLAAGEAQVDEAGHGAADLDSSQRCPDGHGGPQHTAAYRPSHPTPGAPNECVTDDAPRIVTVSPPDGSNDVAANAALTVTFSEDVTLAANWFTIACATSGDHEATTSGGPTGFTLSLVAPFAPDESCTVTLHAAAITDRDADDPPDKPAADHAWRFHIAAAAAPSGILINELDSDTPGSDTAEFIELFDGGRGQVALSGLVVVLWNGRDDTAYAAVALTGQHTNADGYFVIGRADLADLPLAAAALQNGPDAVALYAGRAADFAHGAPLTTNGLRDAVVYGPAAEPDTGLLTLLEAGQPQLDEAALGDPTAHALQRCPNGEGGPRRTSGFRPAPPTPGQPNPCALDAAPAVAAVRPAPNATDVSPTATLTITFTEAVTLGDGWLTLSCGGAAQSLTTLPGDITATAIPAAPLPPGRPCLATVHAPAITDRDNDDPPDTPAADFAWTFTVAAAPPPVVAAFSSNSPVWIDAPVVFTNTTTGPAPLAYTWDFGDGTGATTPQPTHRYAAPGVYTVTLTATHGDTIATAGAVVVVRPRLVFVSVVVR